MKILSDQWGRIPAVEIGGWTIVWSWPHGPMVWFMWNKGASGMKRIGPVTVWRR